VHAHQLENQAIEVVAQALNTDDPSTFEGRSSMDAVGYSMTKRCADQVFTQAGFKNGMGRELVGVVELHDCFAANEVGRFLRILPTMMLRYRIAAYHLSRTWTLSTRRRTQVSGTW
jgi:hypothetical protein